jgi:hypothetical protein
LANLTGDAERVVTLIVTRTSSVRHLPRLGSRAAVEGIGMGSSECCQSC